MAMITDRSAHGFPRGYLCSPQALFWVVAGTAVGNLVTRLMDCQDRTRQRRRLLALDGAVLKDFGRNSADASAEGNKPYWRP